MQGLWSRFRKIKKSIGGNREKMGYEETFGTPREEQWHVTPPVKANRRIIAQLEFALNLAAEHEKRDEFQALIGKSLALLETALENDGVLTNLVCEEAEKVLLPLGGAAKEYSLILAAHAHIDMNWMWGWQETVAATLGTFRTMLALMDEYPDFCFSQSQASVYKIAEDFDPELMDAIKARIKEGRWEVTATAWVETDKNMPSTESLLRHIKYTRDYLEEVWGVDPSSQQIDFSPDTFGHSEHVPEINSFGEVKYYYHCRGFDGDNCLYRWRAPSGSEVLVHREQHWYNAAITTEIAPGLIDIAKRSGGLKTGLLIYGVGNHGGGPTRRDIERALEFMQYPVYPKIKFGTMLEYFKLAETVRENLPVVERSGGLNYIFPGCYTTQSRIKLGNRKSEKALIEADLYSSLAGAYAKHKYQYRQFESAWQNVLFTHFHDILTGSCVEETREHAMGLYAGAMAAANTQHSNALRVLSENIDTSGIKTDDDIQNSQSEGAGVGYGLSGYTGVPNPERGSGLVRIFNIFNALPLERTENVEITVWDYTGDMRYLQVVDAEGEKLEFALIDSSLQQYWDHKYFRLLVKVKVPAAGYTTIVLKPEEKDEYVHYFNGPVRTAKPHTNYILENEYIKAEFDCKSGAMISFTDKQSGTSALAAGKTAGLQFVQTEPASSNAWNIGRYLKIEPIDTVTKTHPLSFGDLRKGFYIEKKIYNSTIRETVYLEKNAKAITYKLNIDWHETAGQFVPVLHYNFPLAYSPSEYMYDVPAGVSRQEAKLLDVPALSCGAAVNPENSKGSLAIVTDCKYGYRAYENNLSATLINSSSSPDPYPERGIHNITLSVGFAGSCPKALINFSAAINHPFNFVPANSHKGALPLQKSLFGFESASAVLSSVTTNKNGELIIRFIEVCGKESDVVLSLDLPVKSAVSVDLTEKEIKKLDIEDSGKITVKTAPNTIGAVKVRFA
ncbi:MAG: glycosyl hydrolase-related protein [Oscillospiraceae bacterium]|nr:glycosyl hydrolase-related protein [Oscillospiraceae bacterium]